MKKETKIKNFRLWTLLTEKGGGKHGDRQVGSREEAGERMPHEPTQEEREAFWEGK